MYVCCKLSIAVTLPSAFFRCRSLDAICAKYLSALKVTPVTTWILWANHPWIFIPCPKPSLSQLEWWAPEWLRCLSRHKWLLKLKNRRQLILIIVCMEVFQQWLLSNLLHFPFVQLVKKWHLENLLPMPGAHALVLRQEESTLANWLIVSSASSAQPGFTRVQLSVYQLEKKNTTTTLCVMMMYQMKNSVCQNLNLCVI